MRILVTGSGGFIAGHLAKALFEMGHEVYGTQFIRPVPEEVIPLVCDLRRPRDVWEAVIDSQPEIVFHLASQPIVTIGEDAERYTYECNVQGTFNLLDALKDWGDSLKLFVGASTDKVYGRNQVPYHEDTPLSGNRQMYETTKTMQDHLMQCYSGHFKTIITRCCNVYGPGDFHETRIVPHTISQYLNNDFPIIRSNGQQYRDYMYISDCVDAYIRCMDYGQYEEAPLSIFNFGASTPVRTLDLVSMIREYFPNSKDPIIEYGAQDEISRQYLSFINARRELGWSPQVSLRDGISQTVEWWRENEK